MGNVILFFISDVKMSHDDWEAALVKWLEHNVDVTEDVHVFDFFEKTVEDYKFKKFLSRVTEKNMLLYLEIKSRERAKYRH